MAKFLKSKTPLEELKNVVKGGWNADAPVDLNAPSLIQFEESGMRFDFLFSPKKDSDKLFVMFSGDALRQQYEPPVFQRWTWAPHFPGHCLYISDPSLFLADDLGLAWYAGTQDFDPQDVISTRIQKIAEFLGVTQSNIYTYGSSGGGFAAIRMQLSLPKITAIAVNPQTSILNYNSRAVEKYLSICFNGRSRVEMREEFPRRVSLLENVDILKSGKILISQNESDKHHYSNHLKPFCKAIGVPVIHDEKHARFRRFVFDLEGGHNKAETPEVFREILRIGMEMSDN